LLPTQVAEEKLKAEVESLAVDKLWVNVLLVAKVIVDAPIFNTGI
jgi:hypothetical protein